MALTKYFKDTIMAPAKRDSKFRHSMLEVALNEFLAGDIDQAKAMLKDYINAIISFTKLADDTGIHIKSLQRMLGPNGNPTLSHFCEILKAIQTSESIALNAQLQQKILAD